MQLTKHQLREIWASDKKKDRKGFIIAIVILVAVFLFCMSFRYLAYGYEEKFVPIQHLKSFFYAIKWTVTGQISNMSSSQVNDLIASVGLTGYYGSAFAQLKMIGMGLVAGAALCISGAVFQTAYRNPMASPNMIGATAGVSLGNVVVVMLFSYEAYDHMLLRYEYCYGFTAICVGLTLILGKIAGDKHENISVMEMVMVGSIGSQMINVITMFIMYNLEDEDLLIYEEIQMGTYQDLDWFSTAIFFGVMAISVLPVLLMRYRLNGLSMDRMETSAIGINAGPIRLVAQICAALMVACAMVHCGEVGMLSMIIPVIVRNIVGADFRKVAVYSAVSGAVLVMLCRLVTSFFTVLGETLPVSFLMNIILMPLFLIIIAKQGGIRFNTDL